MKPGIYTDLSNDAYHAETEWLSSTQLKALLPEHYKTGGSSPAREFGTLVHTAVLEPELLDQYVALDAARIGVKADGSPAQNPTMTAAWKKAVAEVEADGKTVIDEADLVRALSIRQAILMHDEARAIFDQPGDNELSLFAEDADGIRHKARFDRVIAGEYVDLKTTSAQPGYRSLTAVVMRYGYDLSAAHYLEVARLEGMDAKPFTLVFVESRPPHRVTVAELDPFLIDLGRARRREALARHIGAAEPYEGATGRIQLLAPEWALPDDELEFS